MIYHKVLTELNRGCYDVGENMQSTITQAGKKSFKCVSDCKKAAITIKTATGIKRFQEEKEYGAWFDSLFALIKTKDSCQTDRAFEQ